MAAAPSADVAMEVDSSFPDYMWVAGKNGAKGELFYFDGRRVISVYTKVDPFTPVPTTHNNAPAVFLPDPDYMDDVGLYIRAPEINGDLSRLSSRLQKKKLPMLWVDVSRGNKLQRAGHGENTTTRPWAGQQHYVDNDNRTPGTISMVVTEPNKLTVSYHTDEEYETDDQVTVASFIPFYIPADHYQSHVGPLSMQLALKDQLRGSKGATTERSKEERRETWSKSLDAVFSELLNPATTAEGIGKLNAAFSHTVL